MAVAMIPNLLSRVSKFRSSNRSKGSTSEKSSPSQPWIVVMNSVTDPGFSGKGRGVGHNPKILWRGRKGAFLVCKFGKKCLGQQTKKLISDPPPPHHLLLFVQRKRHVPPVPLGLPVMNLGVMLSKSIWAWLLNHTSWMLPHDKQECLRTSSSVWNKWGPEG